MTKTARRGRSATRWLAVVLATLVAGAPVARADEITSPVEPRTTWYGWETLLSDTGAIGLWVAAAVVDDAKYGSGARQSYEAWSHVLTGAGFVAYGLGAPAVHLAHGDPGKMARSLGLRLGLPVGGALFGLLVGVVACDQSENEVPCPIIPATLGFIAGGVAAMVLDAAVIARAPTQSAATSRLQAVFVPTGSGGTFVLGGRF